MEADGIQIEQEIKRAQMHTQTHIVYLQRITMNATRQFFSRNVSLNGRKKERKSENIPNNRTRNFIICLCFFTSSSNQFFSPSVLLLFVHKEAQQNRTKKSKFVSCIREDHSQCGNKMEMGRKNAYINFCKLTREKK